MVLDGASGQGATPRRRFTDGPVGSQTVISEGCAIDGTVSGDVNLDLRGHIQGRCTVSGFVTVGRQGRLSGFLGGADVVVEGEIEGDIEAIGKVELRATAKVKGDITAAAVAMAEGSFFEGTVKMVGEGSAKGVVRFTEKRGDPHP